MKTATEDSSNSLFQKTGDLISLANVTDSLNINDTLIVNSSSGRVGISEVGEEGYLISDV